MNTSTLARRLQEFDASEARRAKEQGRHRTQAVTPFAKRARRVRIQIRDCGLRPFRVR